MIARLCTTEATNADAGLREACVYLYKLMGWYEEAVDVALTLDVSLATDVANSVQSDFKLAALVGNESHLDDLTKTLWLRIAHHVIEKEQDVNKAMHFLHDMNETIVIEDVLPYFPDFVTIDQFKDAIRSSLAAYTDKIGALKQSIEQAALSAQCIRADIQSIRQKSMQIAAHDKCAKCTYRLITRRFYVFPCRHAFHSDCLLAACAPFLLPSKQRRIDELDKLLQDIHAVPNTPTPQNAQQQQQQALSASTVVTYQSKAANASSSAAGGGGSKAGGAAATYSGEEIARLKSELDELLADECPWCGERILKLINEPFIDELAYETVFNSWL